MKIFKGFVFASNVFDVHVYLQFSETSERKLNIPYLKKVHPVLRTFSAWTMTEMYIIISKAEKVQSCGKTSIALPSYTVRMHMAYK